MSAPERTSSSVPPERTIILVIRALSPTAARLHFNRRGYNRTRPPSRKDRGWKRAGSERGVRQPKPSTHKWRRRHVASALPMERELPASFQSRCARHTGSVPPMTNSPQELFLGARISDAVVMLAPEARRRHLYIIAQTATGKSTLLLNLTAQDLAAGHGLALPDPHGALAD